MLKKINKKILIIVLVVIAVVFAIIAIVVKQKTELTNDSYANCAVGDVNGDGFINSQDALIIDKFINNKVELFETQQKNADVNVDGEVNQTDSQIILKYAAGAVRKLPYTGEEASKADNYKQIQNITDDANSTARIFHSWDNGDGTYSYQIEVNITNLKESDLRNWKTEITLSADAEKSKSWSCECEVSGNTVTMEGEEISEDESLKCGVIVIAAQGLKVESIVTSS